MEREYAYLDRPTSPYRRLKLAMDYWCALWFWPIQEAKHLPTRRQYLNEVSELFKGAAEEFFRKLEGKVKQAKRMDGAVKVIGALDNYGKYFDDSGFQPIAH